MTSPWITRKGHEYWSTKAQFCSRLMPYGTYYCADGREVLYDRDYVPICERRPGQPARLADPKEWVQFKHQQWLYNDANSMAAIKRCQLATLKEWGMLEEVNSEIERLVAISRQRRKELRHRG